jgi:hypothetical protein
MQAIRNARFASLKACGCRACQAELGSAELWHNAPLRHGGLHGDLAKGEIAR